MKLIVNADDYGITMRVSEGILHGMKQGLITDTSALVNSVHFEKSSVMALEAGITAMGVHLNLTFMAPVLEASAVQSIVDKSGRFYRKPGLIPASYDPGEVRTELKAQIEKFLASGLKLNHLDTHHGVSIKDTQILDLVMELAREYNVPMRRDDLLSGQFEGSWRMQVFGLQIGYVVIQLCLLYRNHGFAACWSSIRIQNISLKLLDIQDMQMKNYAISHLW